MLLRDFPDLEGLKQKIASEWANGKNWPSVVLNVETSFTHRPNLTGPLSLFVNLRGTSRCAVGKHAVHIEESAYFLSNAGDVYSLDIDPALEKTETFNIHFGNAFASDLLYSLSHRDAYLLEAPFEKTSTVPEFFSHLYAKDPVFENHLKQIREAQRHAPSALQLEEQLAGLLSYLLLRHQRELKTTQELPALRASTRKETWKRLSRAADRIQSEWQPLSLDALAETACMSKFHFLRLFQSAYGLTPHAYYSELRMKRASALLRRGIAASQVASDLGFSETSSFSRSFKKYFGLSPEAWKKAS